MTQDEALIAAKTAAICYRFIISQHAQTRMNERGVRVEDLRKALCTAKTAYFQTDDDRWRLEGGTDTDGDALNIVVKFQAFWLSHYSEPKVSTPMKTNKETRCPDCGGELVHKHHNHVEEVGPVKVTNSTAFALTCKVCGSVSLSALQLREYELRSASTVLRDGRFVSGAVLRYARRALGLTQSDLGHILGSASETVSRWETGSAKIPQSDQLALAGLLDGVWLGQFTVEDLLAPKPSGNVPELEVPPIRSAS